ncbi:MAG: SPFH domain-containing protein [Candidatus Nomurabacteria bacterium]|nr:SPFH domain-containing protein [Candidatus Nomurabacteria bacterium]
MEDPSIVSIIVWSVIGFVAIYSLIASIYQVSGKEAKILETFGKPHEKASFAGLHFKMPFPITEVVGVLSLQLQEIEASVSVKTLDNAFMDLPVKVQYKADGTAKGAVKAHYELDDPETQIRSYVLNESRGAVSSMTMDDLYKNRDKIETTVREALKSTFEKFGYIIENVLVDEPQPSKEVKRAFNKVIASERDKEAAQNEADAEKIRRVGKAEAEATSKKLQGEGMAAMREAIAKGATIAVEELRKATPDLSDQQLVDFLMEINRMDTMTTIGEAGNLVVMDLNKNSGSSNDIANILAAFKITSNGKPDVVIPAEDKVETTEEVKPTDN